MKRVTKAVSVHVNEALIRQKALKEGVIVARL